MDAKIISEVFEQKKKGNPVEDLLFLFADQNILLTQPRLIRRYNSDDDRFYWFIENGELSLYPSTTTFVSKVLGYGNELLDWYAKNGMNAYVLRDQSADFGTLGHICCAELFTKGYDFKSTLERVQTVTKEKGHPLHLNKGWTIKLNKTMASWAKFVKDYDFVPILIEGMLASDEIGIAGTIDYVGYITYKGKRILVQIDIKTGGIHESAEAQLAINKVIFEENFPHLQIEGLFNWSPKDYRDEPTYTFVDQTKSRFNSPEAIDAMLTMYSIRQPKNIADRTTHIFGGQIGSGCDISDYTQAITLRDSILHSLRA